MKNNKQLKPSACTTSSSHVNIHRICLTGGACSGRRTALAELKKELTALGFKVLVVPNTAVTIMGGTGLTEAKLSKQA